MFQRRYEIAKSIEGYLINWFIQVNTRVSYFLKVEPIKFESAEKAHKFAKFELYGK